MLLVLVNTSGGKEILKQLEGSSIDFITMLPSVYDAGLFGIGDALTGSLKDGRIRRVLAENKINAVIDALNENEAEASFTVSRICSENKIPLLKYLPFEADYSEYDNVKILDNVGEAADILNSDDKRTLMFGSAEKIKDIAEWVLDKRKLYTAVLKGSEMDIDFSVESSIPFANIIPSGSIEGASDISSLAERYKITRFVCYENISVLNKLTIAKSIGAEVLMIKKPKPEYYTPFDTADKIVIEAKRIEEEVKRQEEEERLKALKKQEQSTADENSVRPEKTENNSSEAAKQEAQSGQNTQNTQNVQSPQSDLEKADDREIKTDLGDETKAYESKNDSTAVSAAEMKGLLSKDSVVKISINSESSEENSEIEEKDSDNTFGVPKSKVVNDDGTVNMSEFVKYVKQELDIE